MPYTWNYQKFASTMKSQRKALGLSFGDLGLRLGMDPANVRKYEIGLVRRPRIDTLMSFAKALKLDITDLLDKEAQDDPS
jgi:transcriptional regulator with XRE-family HTH domain